MKLVKMSLVAAMVMGASAFAIDNVKVDGDAKLYYGTNNVGTAKLFNNGANSFADTALRLGVTGDLMKGVSFGVTGYAVSTLGLENNLVGNTWTNAHSGAGANVGTNGWIGEMWMAGTLGKTTAKVGRMSLDTPLAFSETWSVVPNTFEAAVLINQDIPDTTLIGAWVGSSNGADVAHPGAAPVADKDNMLRDNAMFGTFASHGAYAAAVVNNSLKFLTAQAWYYNVVNVADAYWLQADWDCLLVKNVKVGVQYADMSPKNLGTTLAGTTHDSSAYAAKVGYEGVKNLKVSVAYSSTDKNGGLAVQNVATGNGGSGQSKLYTEAFWNYGYVGAPGAKSYNLTAEYNAGIAQFGLYYTDASVKAGTATVSSGMTEAAVTASKDFGPLNATLAYFSTNPDTANTLNAGKRYDSALAMFKVKF